MNDPNWRALGLTAAEYEQIRDDLGRDPNDVELNIYSVMWSEHCSYKHSRAVLGLLPGAGPRVLQGPGENAGVVDLGDGWAVAFRVESHNHPAAVEPYQGAATGVGGIIRDIVAMGARPVALLNSLRFGPPQDERGRALVGGVVAGVASYGNTTGIPVVAGEIYFEDCYAGNPLVNAMGVGLLPAARLVRGIAAGAGNRVLLAGSRTGRDGIHGVTFASEELALAVEDEGRAVPVQKGDPFLGKLLLEACLEAAEKELLVGMQDLGGAGLACATTETAARAGTGMEIDLDRVPLREEGLQPFEILLSESQERMLLIVTPENITATEEIFNRWGVPLAVLGTVTGDGIVRVKYRGAAVAAVSAAGVAGGPAAFCRQDLESAAPENRTAGDPGLLPPGPDLEQAFCMVLGSLNAASKEWAWRRYHYADGGRVLQGPGGDAALVRLQETGGALAVTIDGNGRQVFLDPYLGGMLAVAEATRNLACTGAEPLGITDGLNFGSPENPEVFRQFRQAVEGIAAACRALEVPVVGGNVSFYNETGGEAIYPTPVIGAVGYLADPERACGVAFRRAGDALLLLGARCVSLGGSEYLKTCHDRVDGTPAPLDLDLEKALQGLLRRAAAEGLIASAHDLSDGGLAVALAESCLAGGVGARIDLPLEKEARLTLFGEGPSRVLVSLPRAALKPFLVLAREAAVPVVELGEVGGDALVVSAGGCPLLRVGVATMDRLYREALPALMEKK